MSRPKKIEVNCETGVTTEIELTDEEIAQNEADSLQFKQWEAQMEAKAQAKAEAKASALAKLQELGLTEEEAISLIP